MAVVVAGGLLAGCLLLPHGGEFRLAGVAAVGVAGGKQLLDGGPVLADASALNHGFAIPLQPQPLQPFEDVGGVFGLAALFVGVFNAQQKLTAQAAGVKPVENRSAGRTYVQRAGWARGQANPNRPI